VNTTPPSDGVFATAVLSQTRLLATCYWARYVHYGKPLVLLDYEVGPLRGSSWGAIRDALPVWAEERRARVRGSEALFVEGDMMAAQAAAVGLNARAIPPWLVAADAWHQVAQSAAAIMARGDVGYTRRASAQMDARPFLTEAGVAAGPRPEGDPITPAFLFGVVLALDPAAARDPHPRPLVKSARS
jgi:hypothetical protein